MAKKQIKKNPLLSDMPVKWISKNTEGFNDVWGLYPRRDGKVIAERHYNKLIKSYTHEQIKDAVIMYAQEKLGTEKIYLKQGSSFFAERIYDYLDKVDDIPLPVVASAEARKPSARSGDDIYTLYLNHMNSLKYNDYLLTDHWKHFVNEAHKHYKHKCIVCDNKEGSLHVHHKTYINLGRETFNDVVLLCADCHRMVHGKHV